MSEALIKQEIIRIIGEENIYNVANKIIPKVILHKENFLQNNITKEIKKEIKKEAKKENNIEVKIYGC